MGFHSVDAKGQPVDTSQRLAASKELKASEDAETIAHYRDPAFVFGGWKPERREVGNRE